jgi:hypothetical protein
VKLAKALNNEFNAQPYGTPETKKHIKNYSIMAIVYSLIYFLMDSKKFSAKAFSAKGISNLNVDVGWQRPSEYVIT